MHLVTEFLQGRSQWLNGFRKVNTDGRYETEKKLGKLNSIQH